VRGKGAPKYFLVKGEKETHLFNHKEHLYQRGNQSTEERGMPEKEKEICVFSGEETPLIGLDRWRGGLTSKKRVEDQGVRNQGLDLVPSPYSALRRDTKGYRRGRRKSRLKGKQKKSLHRRKKRCR